MTGPICLCGHSKLSHEVEDAPTCCHDTCGCRRFRLLGPGQRPQPVPVSDLAVLLREAKDTGAPKCVNLAHRIETELEMLRDRVAAEHARAAARAEVIRLEQELAKARQQLGGAGRRAPRPVYGEFPCPECGEVKRTPQGVGAHRAKVHGYRASA